MSRRRADLACSGSVTVPGGNSSPCPPLVPEKKAASAPYPDLGSHALFLCQHQEECRVVKHVLFSAWPDHQTPESAGPLLRLVAEVEESPETAANTGPIVVHCRYVAPPSPAAYEQVPLSLPLGLSLEGV